MNTSHLRRIIIAITIASLSSSAAFAQRFQVGVSGGTGGLYVHEDHNTDFNYYNAIAFQTDFTFLDTNQLPKYGFSLYSYGADSWIEFNTLERYRGLVSNTGLTISKYFSQQLSKKFSGNLQIGTGLNLETTYYRTTRAMLNINVGAEIKYQLNKKWFLQAKGLAVAQDFPNIIRFFAFDDYQEAGEDLHLLYMIGVAVNIGE